MGAQIMCTFGAAPGSLIVIPEGPPVTFEKKFAATIMDFVPMKNIMPFGMCNSPMNPTFIAATAAKLGVPTPVPCVPITTPWTPGSQTTFIGKKPALTLGSMCMCAWGPITITNPGTTKEMVN